MGINEKKMPWWLIVLTGVIIVAASIFVIADQKAGLNVLILLVAAGALLYGGFNLYKALKTNYDNNVSLPYLIHGLLDVVLFLLIVVIPDTTNLLGIIISTWIIVFGVFEIIGARRGEDGKRGKIGALLVLIGIAALVIPLLLSFNYVTVIAIVTLCFGIYRTVVGIMAKVNYERRTSGGRANLL